MYEYGDRLAECPVLRVRRRDPGLEGQLVGKGRGRQGRHVEAGEVAELGEQAVCHQGQE